VVAETERPSYGGWEPTGRPGDFGPLYFSPVKYLYFADTAVRCLPVVRQGQVIGYLWAAETTNAAGRVGEIEDAWTVYGAGWLWQQRLDEAWDAGFTALEALQLWIGGAENTLGGAIPADAEALQMPNSRAVRSLPTHTRAYQRKR
jgi:hypothetical protein